jgi:TetR/AcrR family tetracycline transcriptional repressor
MDDSIPEPPWRVVPRARAEPRLPLSRESILDAALRVMDREGMDGLSMRRVADELRTGPASLYWHIRNKGELLQLLLERVAGEMQLPEPDPSRWEAQLAEVARAMRARFLQHRDSARISLGRVPAGPAMARFVEWLFELLTPVSIPDRVIAYFGDLASLYVGAYAFEESLGLASPTGENLAPEQIVAMFRDYMFGLPSESFPHIHRAIGDLFGGGPDERFEFGLDIILRGIATFARPGPAENTGGGHG